jgi:hypothetical protein
LLCCSARFCGDGGSSSSDNVRSQTRFDMGSGAIVCSQSHARVAADAAKYTTIRWTNRWVVQ